VKRLDNWAWKSNPFAGTKELKGLIVLMALMNNWDLKDDNNKILLVNNEGGQPELRYIISDLGATFGKTGGFLSRSRNEPEDYVKAKFIEGVNGREVKLAYSGKEQVLMQGITVDDARWIGTLLSRLSDTQLADVFRRRQFHVSRRFKCLSGDACANQSLVNLPG